MFYVIAEWNDTIYQCGPHSWHGAIKCSMEALEGGAMPVEIIGVEEVSTWAEEVLVNG